MPATVRFVHVLAALALASSLLGGRSRAAEAKAAPIASNPPVAPLRLEKPLLAAWSFDEADGARCVDASGQGCDADAGRRLARTSGLFASALALEGNHHIAVGDKLKLGPMPAIAISAWVLPRELSVYREIFRKEDGDNRVLFSFQSDGTILSLGLNINGYVECDAPIRPEQVLDGQWHHCAATFDGQVMRVYLDGREVGSLKHPGTIASGGPAPACIGSSNGGECFQGMLDELRIYREALSAAEIAALWQNGQAALAQEREDRPAGEPSVARPLVAHWRFNQRGGPMLAEAEGRAAAGARIERGEVARVRGIHGKALRLKGEHAITVPRFPANQLAKISFSLWAQPLELTGFRELFRQESPHRLLFSFQQNGSILSLGLDVGGYEECDAALSPNSVLDGQWHHCAGTFDGRTMRVYFDGREIGALERPGPLAIEPSVACFLGSSGGHGEFFQGGLDDLRIYGDALSPEEIRTLYRSGLESMDQFSKQQQALVNALYAPGKTLAESLSGTRKNVALRSQPLDRELAGVLAGRIKARFPEEADRFTAALGVGLVDYLVSGHEGDSPIFAARKSGQSPDEFHPRHVGRLMELLVEYRPLTETQWKKQTPEQLENWRIADAIVKRYQALTSAGSRSRFSPEWIELAIEAASRIQFRPVVQEAVAPYLTPTTPETRRLSAEEAQERLRRDWLHQASGQPTPERIQSEIAWTRQLAQRIAARRPTRVDLAKELQSLAALEKQAGALKGPDQELYFQVRTIKRRVALANPAIDFDKVLLVDMPYPQGSEWPHETRHRLGYMAVPGGRLLVLEGLGPDGNLRQLAPQAPLHGSFWRPDLSFDGRRVVFCFKPHNEKSFHLYEVEADGSRLVQLTDGPYDDLDPIYLPDGHILFSTTRAHTYVRCMPPTNAYVLARCDADGKNLYLVSYNNEPDYLPSVMHDGRVIYTRWEYTDKPLWRAQKLWTMNPDGTQVVTYWGNQSVWPDLLKDARAIPGSRRVMFTGSAHHNWFAGSVGIIDPDRGLNFPDGLTKVTADTEWPESGNGPLDPVESPRYHASGHYSGYYSPYPLGEQDFLVSANRGDKFVLYLMDVDGNRELIYEGTHNVFHAMPLKPRARPPVLADRVAWPDRSERDRPRPGVIYSGNVYYGAPQALQGKARELRIWHIDPKTYTYWHKRPYISTGPVVSAVQSEGVKRLLGTVPIAPDGSVSFTVPPMKAVHFQLLDENGRALQTMRSFVGVMPGERRGCLGCHESHSRAPEAVRHAQALLSEPKEIQPPPWNDRTVSYPRYVQPVLDKYCGKCHQGDGEGRKTLDLTERPSSPVFTEPYLTLIGRPSWGRPYDKPEKPAPGFGIADMLMVEAYSTVDPAAYVTPPPMQHLSYKSRLIELCAGGKHYDVKVDPISLQRLIAWVDAMCPYCGDEEVRAMEDPVFQGVDWLSVRPRIRTAPRIVRPGPLDP